MDLSLNIDIGATIDKFKASAEKVKTTLTGLEQKAESMGNIMPPVEPPGVNLDLMDKVDRDAVKPINDSLLDTVNGAKDVQKEIDRVTEITKDSKKALEDTFDGAALSLLFFGQQLQSVSRSIATSGVQAFNDVISRTTETSTAVDRLSGAFNFLQFRIGEALLPAAGFLTPVIASIADFVSENQRVVRSLVVVGGVLGVVVGTASALKLAYDAAADTIVRLGNVAAITGERFGVIGRTAKSSNGKVSNLTKSMGTLAVAILPIIAVLGVVAALFGAVASRAGDADEGFTENNETVDAVVDAFNNLLESLGVTEVKFESFNDIVQVAVDGFAFLGAIIIDVVGASLSAIVNFVSLAIDSFKFLGGVLREFASEMESLSDAVISSFKAISMAMTGDVGGAVRELSSIDFRGIYDDFVNGSGRAIANLQDDVEDYKSSVEGVMGTFDGLGIGSGATGKVLEGINNRYEEELEATIRSDRRAAGLPASSDSNNMSVAPEGWNDSNVDSSIKAQREQLSLQERQLEATEVSNQLLEESINQSTDMVDRGLRRNTGMSFMEIVNMEADSTR